MSVWEWMCIFGMAKRRRVRTMVRRTWEGRFFRRSRRLTVQMQTMSYVMNFARCAGQCFNIEAKIQSMLANLKDHQHKHAWSGGRGGRSLPFALLEIPDVVRLDELVSSADPHSYTRRCIPPRELGIGVVQGGKAATGIHLVFFVAVR